MSNTIGRIRGRLRRQRAFHALKIGARVAGSLTYWRLKSALGIQGRLPDYLIVGAQKAGTTALQAMLAQHPRVRSAWTKEVHFFDRYYDLGLDWYRAHFPSCGGELGHGACVVGEATPSYLFLPSAPERIATISPDVRIIAILREPVARAFSHYQHEVRRGWEDLGFEDAVAAEPERLAREAGELGPDGALADWRSSHSHHAYMSRGLYSEQLQRFVELLPRSNILILFSEELKMHPDVVLNEVCDFIGIPPLSTTRPTFRNVGGYDANRVQAYRRAYDDMFTEDKHRLAAMLGRALPW